MRINPWDRTKLGACKKTDNRDVLDQFIQSGLDCAKVEGWKHKDAFICVSSLNGSIKIYKMSGIKAVSKHGEVYLIKEDSDAVKKG